MDHRHMSGKEARKRRTVLRDELLKFLKVELLLSTSSTHFFYLVTCLSTISQIMRRGVNKGKLTKNRIYGYREVSGIPSASLLTSVTCMRCY